MNFEYFRFRHCLELVNPNLGFEEAIFKEAK